MLTRVAARLTLCVALVATALFTILPAATAEEGENCWLEEVDVGEGETDWVEHCDDSGGGGGEEDDGGNGDGEYEPQCDLSIFDDVHDGASFWCEGTTACWGNFPSVFPEDQWEELAGSPSPGEGYIVTYVECVPGDGGDWQWVLPPEEQGPSLWDLAWQAFGSLATPDFTLAFSPPTQSFVNLPTWYWADGPADGELIGESTGAVNAIATPNRIEVDPGDGSGVLECPFAVDESDECQHVYAQASVDHPDGYPATMRLVYDIAFTNDGAPLELDGLPTTLESPWVDGPLPVAEAHAIVIE